MVAKPDLGPEADRPPISRSAATTYVTTVAVAFLALVNVLIVSRALGPQGRGEVVFLTTVASLFAYVFGLSLQESNVNLAGTEPHRRRALATNSVLAGLALGAVAAAFVSVGGALVPVLRGSADPELLMLALAVMPILIVQMYLVFLARADFAFGAANAVLFVPAVLSPLINGALALAGALTVPLVIITWVGVQTLATVGLVAHVGLRLAGFGRPDLPLLRRSLGFGLKAHLGGVMALSSFRLDQYMLGVLAGPQQLGLYSVAVAWAESLFFLPTALALVFRPGLVRADPEAARERTVTVLRLALLVTVPLGLAMILLAPWLCITLFGAEFAGSVLQLQLLVPGALGIVALKILGNALIARGRPLLETAGLTVALVLTVVLDLVLIPPYGGVGAAIASSLAYTAAGVATGAIFVRALRGRVTEFIPRPGDLGLVRAQLSTLLQTRRRAGNGRRET